MDKMGLDRAIEELQAHKDAWANLPIREKKNMLLQLRANLGNAGQQWVDATVKGKAIDPESPWVGEAWAGGPWAFAAGINGLLDSIDSLVDGRTPALKKLWTRPNGQLVAQVFPGDFYDRFVLNDLTMEIWMQPEITPENLSQNMAVFYKQKHPQGNVALVLGAGNINSIPTLDLLYKLYVRGQVVVVKMNPVNEYLGPLFEQIFAPFVSAGYVQFVYGAADVGAYLVDHEGVDTIHITGSARTYETIVFGSGPDGQARKRRNDPILQKPITSELGGASPIIVVPGPWDEDDIHYQVENILTMKFHNAGCNCVSAQMLLLPERWQHSDRLLDSLRQMMAEMPPREDHYPGSAERQRTVVAHHPHAEQIGEQTERTLITNLDPAAEDEYCFVEELFNQVLAQVSLPGDTPSEYLQNAVIFCNEKLQGTLGATIIIHPETAKKMGPVLESAVSDLRYGAIGINIWCAAAFLLPQAAWGSYPGQSHDDIQSGIGFVHNSYMFEKPQKTVIRGSFYSFPRAWRHGDFHTAPKPAWFVTNKTAHTTIRRVARLTTDPNPKYLPGILISALRG